MPDRRLLATVWLTATVGVALAEWPQWLGPKRDGTATVRIGVWQGGLPVLWRQPVGEGHSGPVVAGGLVYVHARVADREQEEVLALQLKTGQVVWRQAYDRPKFENPFGNGPRATPLVTPDGQLFTLGASGILCCWDARTGKLFWRKDLLAEFSAKNLFFGVSSSPLLVTEQERKWLVLMVGGADATLVALDPANGQTLWKSGNDPASYSSPVLMEFGGRKLIVALTARHLVAMDVSTGRWLATYPFADKLNETAITPVIIGDRVFISSITAGSVLLRLREQDGQLQWQELWKNPQLNCYFATPVIVGEHLFCSAESVAAAAGAVELPEARGRSVDMETAGKQPHPWQISRYFAACRGQSAGAERRRRAVAYRGPCGEFQRTGACSCLRQHLGASGLVGKSARGAG
jgi:outer membrane protein assembly factor BamB